jgi:DNA helicase-2/ATP-dependent DNA helicase PcrA
MKIAQSKIPLVRKFIDLIVELRDLVKGCSPPLLLRILFDKSGYLDFLKDQNKEEKIKNLDELYNAVEEYSKENPSSSISEFIEEVSLNQGISEDDFQNNRVSLITLHNAKGLEFRVVFIAGLEEGIFPHYLSGDNQTDLQEERRLCYVGMTRAMEKLYLSAAKVRKLYGRSVERGLSNFIQELPQELIRVEEEKGDAYITSTGKLGSRSDRNRFYKEGFHSRNRKEVDTDSVFNAANKEKLNIEVNNRIMHKQFGKGTVLEVENEIAVIRFDDGKKMKFMLKYTPLIKEE